MSSSQTSSSSTSPPPHAHGFHPAAPSGPPMFPGLMDVTLPVAVRLGSGSITVGACLALRRHSVVRLDQSAGQDLDIVVNGETVARGEVAIVDDSTSIRLTDISVPQHEEVDA